MKRSGVLRQRGTHRARWRALSTVLASLVMIIGYAIIAIPTGIVTVELSRAGGGRGPDPRACASCGRDGHDADARFCKHCGVALQTEGTERGSTGAQGSRPNRSRPRSAT